MNDFAELLFQTHCLCSTLCRTGDENMNILNKLHEATMKILSETGVKFLHKNALSILKKNGIKVSGEIAYFEESQILRWIQKAPESFTLFARNPKYNMKIGGESTEFAAGYGAPSIIEQNGAKRLAVIEDYIQLLKLVHQCDHFNINGGLLVQPSNIEIKKSYPLMLYNTIIYSDKCIMGGSSGAEESKETMGSLKIVFGTDELMDKPRVIKIVNSISPLMWETTALRSIFSYAEHGQPVIVTPGPMAGTTSPVTLAGTIALSNAESLACIALIQMIYEGTPVVYGCQATTADMATGQIAIGSPECALCVEYGARLAKMYRLPCRGGGTNTDAKFVSAQSGYESMMVMISACREKMNLIPHSAGMLDSYGAMSYEKFMIDLEIIGMIKRYLEGLNVNDDTLALSLIKQVGPGGEFMTTEHTVNYCRKEPWIPGISMRGMVGIDNFSEAYMKLVNDKMKNALSNYKKPDFPNSVDNQLRKYLLDY